MKCPKCEEGTLGKIKFKLSGKIGLCCNFCDAVWFDNENVEVVSGHTLRNLTDEQGVIELDDQDQDHQPIKSIRYL